MFPASTKSGAAVLAFPDVCKTPSPGGPVPIPYPLTGAGAATPKRGTKGVKSPAIRTKGSHFKSSTGDEPGTLKGTISQRQMGAVMLRKQLNQLHARLVSMPGDRPDHWHEVIDQYVLVTADLYRSLASD